jgi:hypothetical protein
MTDQAITANFDKTVDQKEIKFTFKKDKLGNKRPQVDLKVLVPSVEGIIAIIEAGGKPLELLLESVQDVIRDAISADVSDNEKFDQSTYDGTTITVGDKTYHKYSFEGIAYQPKEDRRAAIPEETWKAWAADYLKVMPGVTNKTEDQIGNAIFVFTKKFAPIKTDKPSLSLLKQQLALYIEHSPEAENFTEILELLTRKVDMYLNADDMQKLIANL